MNNVNLAEIYVNGEAFIYPEQLYNAEEIQSDRINDFNLYFICYVNALRVINIDNNMFTIEIEDKSTDKRYFINIKELEIFIEFYKRKGQIIENIEKSDDDKCILIKFESSENKVKIPIYILLMNYNYNDNIEDVFTFDILYIGQSKGRNKQRNALDRLKNHETLQEITIKNKQRNKDIIICLFSATNKIYSEYINFIHKDISKPLTKEQTINIAESGLINYFKSLYNEKFKNGVFPTQNLKTQKNLFENSYFAVILNIDFSNYSIEFKGKRILSNKNSFIQGKWLKTLEGESFFVKDIIENFSNNE
ncbi:TPA: hypothetical protein O4F65_001326 [Staphylococcus aureus]|uniref:hypothetical protein n=1 Tax=Staphylococcus aureus TaxID=1280 RepID=UPI0006BADE7D|nr:hypothetical protein [Staphylococcus aureus]HCZ8192665.1 hypothetical protein [Staphylococcus aureus]HCZ8196667.1 hypothetical protein [Staphylococcus aureus]HCZ8223407.1 hypothetical protein [Staphylococcus aureus]HCZ8226307.1 hypothetical protein [Staphylococcus aureus]HCZ8229091.1 hypothetical protein [Staphylococcus aureus]